MAISAQKSQIHLAIATWEWGSYFDPQIKIKGIRLGISAKKPDSFSYSDMGMGLLF